MKPKKPLKTVRRKPGAGRPSTLTDELSIQIRNAVLDGKNYVDIQRELSVPNTSWDLWVRTDYQGFRGLLAMAKKERLVSKAVKNLEDILNFGDVKGNELKVKADVSKFVAERLNKDDFSTKQEVEQKIISLSLSELFDKSKDRGGKKPD